MTRERPPEPNLDAARREHRRLLGRAAHTHGNNVAAVLNLGVAVLVHGAIEPLLLEPVLRWVDPTVRNELEDEHASLERDLRFLEEMSLSEPGSDDTTTLSEAILDRLRRHVLRDERTLYRPLEKLRATDAERSWFSRMPRSSTSTPTPSGEADRSSRPATRKEDR